MIDWTTLDFKNKTSGEVQMLCPVCSHTRKKKGDKCLSVNLDKGTGYCHHCQETTIKPTEYKMTYEKPKQDWTNHTSISDALVKWFSGRGIGQQTLIDCKITEEKYYQPAEGKEVNNVVFNYFEGDQLVNKKYRSAKKQFTQTKGAKKVFYGINNITDEVYIVEGEMDKLAFWEIGIKNCISVPNGANDCNDVFQNAPQLEDIKKVYIAVDMDEPGLKLERELIKRFGKWRCERIKFTEKDANAQLIKGRFDFESIVKSPIPYPVDGTFTASDISDDIYDYYTNGLEDTVKPLGARWRHLNKEFSIMMGQLTTVTGIPSHGKSNFIEDYVLSLVKDGYSASFFSPEHFPMKLHHGALAQKVIGKPFLGDGKMTKSELQSYIDWSSDKVYLTYPEKGESVKWEWLLNKFKEQLFRYGIDIFVIDAFNKVKRTNPDSLGEINDVLSELCLFAQAYNVHIFLIAHPTKMRKQDNGIYSPPTLYDVKGSGDFRDQSHNGLCIYRYFASDGQDERVEVINLKTKFYHQGNIGNSSTFSFDKQSFRYYPKGEQPDRQSMTSNKKEELNRNIDFDNPTPLEDIPF